MRLLEAIAPGTADDVYFLGDLIDRGPKSAQVVDFVQNSSYLCLLGNHELMALRAFTSQQVNEVGLQAWMYSGGLTTLESYQSVYQLLAHLEWFRTLPLYLDLGDLWLVHAGIDPERPVADQTDSEFCWIRDPFHYSPRPYFEDKLVIIGHTITFTMPGVAPGALVQGPGWLDIDTGAYHPKSGWLTGVDMTHRQVYQFNVHQNRYRILSLQEAVVPLLPKRVSA